MELPTHIVACGGLVRKGDELLLVRHPRRGWEFPGGMVDPGESLPQALIREIREESGATARVDHLVGLYSNTKTYPGYNGVKEIPTIVNMDFLCTYLSGELITSAESLDSGWFSQEEALAMVTHEYLRYRLENLLSFDGSITCDAFYLPFRLTEHFRFPEQP